MLLAVLGDSLTYGFPFGPYVSWLQTLGENLAINTLNEGVCGETTSDMKKRLPYLLKNNSITHIIIFGGANDIIMDNRQTENIVKDINLMQRQVLQTNLQFGIVLPLIPADKYFEQKFLTLREELKKVIDSQTLIIDFQNALVEKENSINYLDDGVHFSIQGNNKIAEYATIALKSWLKGE